MTVGNDRSWSLYVLHCEDGTYYTGVARDVARRYLEHATGNKAAKYTRARRPLVLAYAVEVGDKSLAMQLEYRVKRLSHAAKREIVSKQPVLETLVRQCMQVSA